jgi:CheY-like chemotaxis protein
VANRLANTHFFNRKRAIYIMTHALIIDDNQSNINVLAMLLQGEGATHTAVLNPHDLSDILADTGAVDVVFLDLEFPTNNGFTLIEKLRMMERFNGVPIIAYSVHISEIEEVRQRGFDGFLGKPLDADQFPEQFARIMRGESVWEIMS